MNNFYIFDFFLLPLELVWLVTFIFLWLLTEKLNNAYV